MLLISGAAERGDLRAEQGRGGGGGGRQLLNPGLPGEGRTPRAHSHVAQGRRPPSPR